MDGAPKFVQPFKAVEQGNYHVILHTITMVRFMIEDTLIFCTE